MAHARAALLGVQVSAIHLAGALDFVASAIAEGGREYICTCPVYTVMLARDDKRLQAAIDGAGLAAPDGMGVVWALKIKGHDAGRVYGSDVMLAAWPCVPRITYHRASGTWRYRQGWSFRGSADR